MNVIDLNSKTAISERVTYLVDERIDAAAAAEPRRGYLGASVVGLPCERQVQYHYLCALGRVERRVPGARVARIFDRGHVYEEKARRWLKAAGFVFATKNGNAFSDFNGRFGGHVDGVIGAWRRADVECPLNLPVLWECKCLGEKNFNRLQKERLRKYSSTYFAQVQLYMGYLGLDSCLFTAINANSMAFFHQLVRFDPNEFSLCRARVAAVIETTENGSFLPRCTQNRDFFQCKWCDFSDRCWNDH
jgi:hypothetical protein